MGQIAHPNVGTFLSFSKIPIVCKWKFNAIYKQYKDDKITNGISGNDRYECPFYDALDSWWHQNGNVMKHIMLVQMKLMKLWAIHNFKQILIVVLKMMLIKSP
jgi:hypothetical protein